MKQVEITGKNWEDFVDNIEDIMDNNSVIVEIPKSSHGLYFLAYNGIDYCLNSLLNIGYYKCSYDTVENLLEDTKPDIKNIFICESYKEIAEVITREE